MPLITIRLTFIYYTVEIVDIFMYKNLSFLSAAPYPPPVNVSLTRANSTSLSFSWDPVSPSCSTIFYNISSTNCGLCPQSTSSTSATCSIMEQLSSEATTCSFTLQSVACDNIASANGDTVTAILKGTMNRDDVSDVSGITDTYITIISYNVIDIKFVYLQYIAVLAIPMYMNGTVFIFPFI